MTTSTHEKEAANHARLLCFQAMLREAMSEAHYLRLSLESAANIPDAEVLDPNDDIFRDLGEARDHLKTARERLLIAREKGMKTWA